VISEYWLARRASLPVERPVYGIATIDACPAAPTRRSSQTPPGLVPFAVETRRIVVDGGAVPYSP
jgi:hypothetical protein